MFKQTLDWRPMWNYIYNQRIFYFIDWFIDYVVIEFRFVQKSKQERFVCLLNKLGRHTKCKLNMNLINKINSSLKKNVNINFIKKNCFHSKPYMCRWNWFKYLKFDDRYIKIQDLRTCTWTHILIIWFFFLFITRNQSNVVW